MKQILFALSFFISFHGFSQRNLTVRKNQSKIIVTAIQSLLIDTLILEDNARIIIDDNVAAFSLIAKHATIGNNVVIDGSRKTIPSNGANGQNGTDAPDYCTLPGEGKNGQNGADGTDAADIFLYFRINSIGSLRVVTDGTNGAMGGNGGSGGAGANSSPSLLSACTAKPGGSGGKGGNGGSGGRGGTLVFNYSFIDPSGHFLSNQPPLSQVQLETNGGKGGNGGIGGQTGHPGKKTSGIIDQSLNQSVPISINGSLGQNGKGGSFSKTNIKQDL